MAKVVQSQQQVIVEPWWARNKQVGIGLGLGIIWWLVTSLLNRLVVEPLACQDISVPASCVNSFGISGSIAAVAVAIIGLLVLVKLLQPRPLIAAAATAALLWDLGAILTGLAWWEALLWAVFFYGVSYWVFGLVARFNSTVVSVITAIVVVLIIRILLVL